MDLLDYEFHLFTERGTGIASVLYRAGPTGYRLAQVIPPSPEQLAPFKLPLTISAHPPHALPSSKPPSASACSACRSCSIDAAQGRASVLYHRYDGHYGLITPAC